MLAIDNFMIGIGGIATFKKSQLPETIKEAIPLSKIVLETDSPYMAPVPHRGKRNESAFIDNVADKIAEIFGCAKETVVRHTTENALSVFRI
jgi:TatD DNase family protein